MAEVLEAVLQLQIDQFTSSLQQAAAQVTAFAQSMNGALAQSTTSFQTQVQQINALAEATRKASAVARTTKKEEVTDIQAQEKAAAAASLATYKYIEETKQQFFRQTVQMEGVQAKERQAVEEKERRQSSTFWKEMEDQKQLVMRQTTQRVLDENRRRETAERDAATRIKAIREASSRDLDVIEERERSRAEMRFRANNARANASAGAGLNPMGQGPGGALVAQDLFLLQGYVNLTKQATQEGSAFDGIIGRVGTSIRTLGGYFAASMILSIPLKIAEWGKASVETAMKMESLRASFNAITGSATGGAKDLDFVRQVANRVGVDFLTTAQSFKSLEAAARGTKLEGEKVKILFEQLSGSFRVLGLTSDQAGHALLAVEQMISKGTISAEELRRQLGNAMPGAVSIMARSLGVGTEELMKMMKAGELLAVDVLPKFGNQVQKEFGPGLAQASRTAVATFAKLGNEIREISVLIGGTLLKALQPAADFITTLLAKAREARELQEKTAAKVGAEVRAGKPIFAFSGTTMELAAGFTEQEAQQAERMVERIVDLRKRLASAQTMGRPQDALRRQVQEEEEGFRQLNTLIEERTKLRKQEDANDDMAGRVSAGQAQADANAKYAKSVKEVLDLQKQLPTELKKITSLSEVLPTIYGKAEDRLRVIKKLMEDYRDLLDKSPNLRFDPAVQKALGAGETAAKSVQAEIDAREALEKKIKDDARERERIEKENLANAKQLVAERIRIEEQMSLVVTEATQGEADKKIEAMQKVLFEARRTGVAETTIAQYEATVREKIRTEEVRKSLEVDESKLAAVKRRADEQIALEQLITETEVKATATRLDDFLAAQDKKRLALQEGVRKELISVEDVERFEKNVVAGASRITQEEHDKAAKEAEKSWRELGNTIEGVLGGAFANILKGSKNLFEGLRDAFLSLLARMAADAIAHAIIIPAIVSIIGGGGVGGGSGGGLAGAASTLSGSGSGGVGGGSSSGGGSMISQGLGLVSAGNALSGALGGPSISMTGGLFSGITSTTLSEIPGIAGLVGPESALGATSLGTIASGVGAGLAVGMVTNQLLLRLNRMMGLNGLGGSVLAGAGAGAAGGAVAGSIIPVIGTAVGAIGGTILGALGALAANLFGGKDKNPRFDITNMQAGQVEYDDVIGLRVKQNFEILDDFHERLGTDYEEFIRTIESGINEMMAGVLASVSGADPEIQRALVAPLNSAFGSIATLIQAYPAIGGEDFKKQLEQMMKDIGNAFAQAGGGAVEELLHAVERIDPIVKAFSRIIQSLLEDIAELERQQKALNATLEGNITTLRESLMSPAQILSARQLEYNNLLKQFGEGDEATRIGLAPRIGELANTILELSKSVLAQRFGDITGIQAAIKTLSESLYTPAQTLAARQGDLTRILQEFRGGTDSVRAVLAPQITGLALQIMELAKGVNTLAEQQALLADFPLQMRAITEALFSPAQSYLSERQQLNELMTRFRGGTQAQQIELEPQIAQLAAQIMQRARGEDVLGQDPQLLRQTQRELVAVMQEVQNTIAGQVHNQTSEAAQLQATLERTQKEMMAVLREVEYVMAGSIVNAGQQTIQALWATAGQIISTDYAMTNGIITAQYYTTNGVVTAQYSAAGQLIGTEHYIGGVLQGSINNTSNTVAGWSNALYSIQEQLIGQVVYARDLAWYSYTQLINALWAEVGLAQEQIRLLVNALYHLETLDAVIQNALGVLQQMNNRLHNPLNINTGESIGTALQRDAINVAQASLGVQRQTGAGIIAVLAKSAYGLEFGSGFEFGRQVVGFQHGGHIPRNMMAMLHQGERVVPEWENRGGGGRSISIAVYGGNRDPGQIADLVIQRIEQKSGRLQSSTIQTSRR